MVLKTHMTIKINNEITKPEREIPMKTVDSVLLKVFFRGFLKMGRKNLIVRNKLA